MLAALEALTGPANVDLRSFLPGVATAFNDGRHLWAVPFTLAPVCIAYQAAAIPVLNRTGAAPGRWTVGELIRVLSACSRIRNSGSVSCLNHCGEPLVWDGFVRGHGGGWFQSGRVSLTGRRVLEGLRAYREMLLAGGVRGGSPADRTFPVRNSFYAGQLGAAGLEGLLQSGAPWKVGVFPGMPYAQVVPAAVTGLAIPSAYPSREDAARFLGYVFSPTVQTLLGSLGYQVATRAAAGARRTGSAALPSGMNMGGIDQPLPTQQVITLPGSIYTQGPVLRALLVDVWRAVLGIQSEMESQLAGAERRVNSLLQSKGSGAT